MTFSIRALHAIRPPIGRPSPAVVISIFALALSATGNAVAAVIISSNSQVAVNTIAGHKPPSGDHANIISGSVDGQDLSSSAVTTTNIATGAVTNAKLGSNAVTSANVVDNSLTGSDVKESTLNGSQISGVNAAQLGGVAAAHYARQYATGLLTADGTGSGSSWPLFGGSLANFGQFVVHCQTGDTSYVSLTPNSGEGEALFEQVQRNGAAPAVSFHQVVGTGRSIQLLDAGVTSLTWQLQDQNSDEIATLIFNFTLGSIHANECTFNAQLLLSTTNI